MFLIPSKLSTTPNCTNIGNYIFVIGVITSTSFELGVLGWETAWQGAMSAIPRGKKSEVFVHAA